jgi:hypothetical protein
MFSGFTNSHFDAYRKEKWRSRAFNLERMAVKEQLGALGSVLAGALDTAGDGALEVELSAEYPALCNQKQVDAQHLYFTRPRAVRSDIERVVDRARGMASVIEDPSPQRSHVVLIASVAVDHVFAGLKLHRDAAVDRQNLDKQLADATRGRELVELVAALPADIDMGIDAMCVKPAAACSLEHVRTLIERLNAPLLPGQSRWLTIGRRIARDQAIALGPDLAGHIERVLVAVLPIYRYVAWSRDNDHIAMAEQMRERAAAAAQRGLSKNDTVRVIAGVFAGRTGVVQEIDGKGMVKVLIGSVPIKLRADALVKQ